MNSLSKFVVALIVTFAASAVGAFVRPDAWYEALTKPALTPPNWVFGPVWFTLYALMAIAAWRVWRKSNLHAARWPLGFFVAQLACNALWSILFFGWHRPDLAFFDIIALWLAIAMTLRLFWQQDRLAGSLLIPYLLWVSFASYLNFAIWRLNA